ncbi:unnamed protein product [Oppiella nova]|uniref:C2H2-type domain-containing protein n=1 Tax=Oppiella nova TaxID=334625 RepID=A0A7R9M1T4_9ACAR|nr:unnamed protein product [Oppiella nova]CAG2169125.1 unnamed protein product [Oppiella nova]
MRRSFFDQKTITANEEKSNSKTETNESRVKEEPEDSESNANDYHKSHESHEQTISARSVDEIHVKPSEDTKPNEKTFNTNTTEVNETTGETSESIGGQRVVDTTSESSLKTTKSVAMTDAEVVANDMGLYACDHPNCSRLILGYEPFLRHKRCGPHETRDGRYLCDYDGCGESYTSLRVLRAHKATHLSPDGYRCSWEGCAAKYITPKGLENHIKLKHGLPVEHRCDREGCSYRTSDKKALIAHLLTHGREREFKCPANGCGKVFASLNGLTDHELAVHPGADIQWMECSKKDCHYKTKSERYMRRHKQRHVKSYLCSQCGKCYESQYVLRQHGSTHNDELKYRCEWPGCVKFFAQNVCLRKHMNTHTREAVYRCQWPGCKKSSVWREWVSDHERRHRGIPVGQYRCHWLECEYRTTGKPTLERHMISTHGMVADDQCSEVVSKRKTNECNLMDRRVKRPKK